MNKKGDLSLNFIVMAAIAVIVLIIIALYFTGGLEKLFGEQKDVIKLSTQEKALAAEVCNFHCSLGDDASYANPDFSKSVLDAGFTNCEGLTNKAFSDYCEGKACQGEGDCAKYDFDDCVSPCVWE
ncbi:MAG: hypothetical protein ABH824_07085 [Nanoarchaeota archaeon]